MPTYEYACTRCGQHVEVFQRLSEEPLTTCGACGGPLRKVFHPAGIVFKGSGFYATDSRPKAKTSPDGAKDGKDGKAAKEAAKQDSGRSSGSSDSSGSSGSSGSASNDAGTRASTGGEKTS